MAEYINRDTFLEQERAWYCDNCDRRKNSKGKTVYEIGEAPCRSCDIGDVLDALEDYPAADLVEVVRCKDCIHANMTFDGTCKYCAVWPQDEAVYLDGDYYCADGERKNDG